MDIDSGSSSNILNSNEEELNLINKMMKLNIYDPKIDKLFKYLFGSEENMDSAKSLINAVLPEKENVEDLEFRNTEINTVNISNDRRGIIVDIYAFDKKNNINVLIEMEVHEKADIIGRAELSSSRIIDAQYKETEKVNLKQRIYSINFLYFDLYPSDRDYYHHLYLHQYGKPDIRSKFRDVIIIELKKFKNQFTKEKMNEVRCKLQSYYNMEDISTSIIDKEIRRSLWFYLLSFVNTVYKKPSGVGDKFFTIQVKKRKRIENKDENEKGKGNRGKKGKGKRKKKGKEKEKENGNENKDNDKNKEDEYTELYIKDEMDYEFVIFLLKFKEIKKIFFICANPPEETKEKINKDFEIEYQLYEKEEQIQKQKEQLQKQDKQIKSLTKDNIALRRQNEEQKRQNEEQKRQMGAELKSLKKKLEQLQKGNNKKMRTSE